MRPFQLSKLDKGTSAPHRSIKNRRIVAESFSIDASARQQFNGYIRHVLSASPDTQVNPRSEIATSKDALLSAQTYSFSGPIAAYPESNTSDEPFIFPATSSNSSDTDLEVDSLRRNIKELEEGNKALSDEIHRLVEGLSDVLDNIKKVPKASRSSIPQMTAEEPGKPDAVSCVISHPGALCCTSTTIRSAARDPSTVTLTIQTTATITEDAKVRNLLGQEELSALAAQAILGVAAELVRTRTRDIQSHTRSNAEEEAHSELCRILTNGTLIHCERNPVVSEFGHESYVCTLQDKVTGRVIKSIFKPRVEGDADGWHRAPMEFVAYRLNRLLGLDYVPPVAYRTNGITLRISGSDEVCFYTEGAMMYFIEDAHQLRGFPESQWGNPPVKKDLLLSDTRILDVLLSNSDRHHGHFLLGRHWCRGRWEMDRWVGELGPCLIDHAAAFRADAQVCMTHENAFCTGPVRCVSAHTYLKLRFLDYATLNEEFQGLLSAEELHAMVKRRDGVLRYLDGLVAEQGYATTVRG